MAPAQTRAQNYAENYIHTCQVFDVRISRVEIYPKILARLITINYALSRLIKSIPMPWRRPGIVVIVSANRTEGRGLESCQGVRY
jgi:hypothetical protein